MFGGGATHKVADVLNKVLKENVKKEEKKFADAQQALVIAGEELEKAKRKR